MAEKNVWFAFEQLNLDESSGIDGEPQLFTVNISDTDSVKQVSDRVYKLLGVDPDGNILQTRNSRGSLIPLNGKLEENTKDRPYTIHVVKEHKRVKAQPRSIRADTYSSTILNQTQIFLSRISNLENTIPELQEKKEEEIRQDIHELENKLNFLQKRFKEADQTEWTGIIKKSPLW